MFTEIAPGVQQLDPGPDERVPVRVVADAELLERMTQDRSVQQLRNVATLPGVSGFVIGMPDMHEGYGFPVGGVAATRLSDGVVTPGGIGFDINCGVRLLRTGLAADGARPDLERVVHELSRSVPTGYGRHGRLSLSGSAMDALLSGGAEHVVHELGLGRPEDLARSESGGRLPADPRAVSSRARERGGDQLGTLGGGNHFLEVSVVDEVFDAATAEVYGLARGELTVLIHTGSRGLGHQVCSDYSRRMEDALEGFGLTVPDRQLACAPLASKEGRSYLGAMGAAANFAWGNRQALTAKVREVLERTVGLDPARVEVVYDVAHNIAKVERHGGEDLCVHRKGATRAFGPGSEDLPAVYRATGQPVFVPGSMGTASFVLAGATGSEGTSFGSCCHGAGRAMSRGEAKRSKPGHVVRRELEAMGIVVRCPSNQELAEEAPSAYKDVEKVVDVVELAGIARKVARLRPLGVLKG